MLRLVAARGHCSLCPQLSPRPLALIPAGLASITIPASSNAGSLRIEQRGTQALTQDAVSAAGVWPVAPALALQPGSGTAFLTAEKLPGTAGPTWVSVFTPSS